MGVRIPRGGLTQNKTEHMMWRGFQRTPHGALNLNISIAERNSDERGHRLRGSACGGLGLQAFCPVTLKLGRHHPIQAHFRLLSFFQRCSDARCHPFGFRISVDIAHLRIWLTSPASPLAPGAHPLANLLQGRSLILSIILVNTTVPFFPFFPDPVIWNAATNRPWPGT
jgi:hypothetical protein